MPRLPKPETDKATQAETPPVRLYDFASLRQTRLNTAAAWVPLVLWRDTITPGDEITANRHQDFCSLYLIRQGRGEHVIDGRGFAVSRGDVYVMRPGQTHWFRNSENLRTDTLHFAPDLFTSDEQAALAPAPGVGAFLPRAAQSDLPAPGLQRWVHLTPTAYRSIAGEIAEIRAEWERGTPDAALMTRSLLIRLWLHLGRLADGTSSPHPVPAPEAHEATVADAVRYLDAHFAEPVRIEAVAAQVCLSPDRFTEVFARAMGRTPRDYLRHLRLEQARTLLQTSDLSIAEVARRSGFGDAAYLSRVLRHTWGTTPSTLRRAPTGPD